MLFKGNDAEERGTKECENQEAHDRCSSGENLTTSAQTPLELECLIPTKSGSR